MTHIINKSDLAHSETSYEFEGHHYADTRVSFIVIDAPPGSGPKLHRPPYEEVFIVQEGSVTFTAGDDIIEASGGQVVVVPAGVTETVPCALIEMPLEFCGTVMPGWMT